MPNLTVEEVASGSAMESLVPEFVIPEPQHIWNSNVFTGAEFPYNISNIDWRYKGHSILKSVARYALEVSSVKWGVFEAILASGSLIYANTLRLDQPLHEILFYAAALIALLSSVIVGINERRNYQNFTRLFFTQCVCITIIILSLTLFSNYVLYSQLARKMLLAFAVIYGACSFIPKIFVYYAVAKSNVKLLWVGNSKDASAFYQSLEKHGTHYALVGCWNGRMNGSGNDGLWSLCRSLEVDQIVLSKEASKSKAFLEYCYKAAEAGCTVLDECTFMEEAFEQVPVEHIKEDWFFQSRITVNGHFQAFSKRAIDIMVSVMVLLLGAPVFAIIWAAVKLSGTKSVIFTQTRMGQFGKPFKMYKFRTMTVGSEDKKAWTQKRDIRITKLGHFLRRTRLDELPQFWNVLKGDMSVVGPRPEIPELVSVIEKDVPYFSFRCWSRPGITGMAQIRYRYCSSICDAREKLRYDLYYIKNWSVMMDIQLMLRTITALMRGSR